MTGDSKRLHIIRVLCVLLMPTFGCDTDKDGEEIQDFEDSSTTAAESSASETMTSTAESDGGADELPPECEAEPLGEVCRAGFDALCTEMSTKSECVGVAGVGEDGVNLWCAWLEPRRYTLHEDGSCSERDENPRCVGGFFAGEGGAGCDVYFDPSSVGMGIVAAIDDRCAGPYTWTSCEAAESRPAECDCASSR